MSKPTTSTPPTPLELARVKFEDELDTATDRMNGAATLLTAMLPTQAAGERDALALLSDALYETADGLQAAFEAVVELQEAETAADGDVTAKEADAPKVSEAAVKDPSVLVSAAGSTEQPKRTDEEIGRCAVADAAHIDALSARAALERLVSLIVQGELDPSVDTDMDAFVVYVDGISARVGEVADALSELAHRS